MVWMPTPEPAPPPLSAGRKGLVWAGVVVVVVALVWMVVAGIQVAAQVGSPMAQSVSSPVYATPLDTVLTLQRSEYAVYELTGHTSGGGGITFTERRAPVLTPADVQVIGPDGVAVAAHGPGGGTETLTRGQDIFTAVAYFTVPGTGSYHVLVDGGQVLHVVISRSLASGLHGVGEKVLALLGGGLVLVVGVVVLIVGLVRRRSRPVPGAGPRPGDAAASAPGRVGPRGQVPGNPPPPGWYPDPHGTRQWWWWDGRTWASGPTRQADAPDASAEGSQQR